MSDQAKFLDTFPAWLRSLGDDAEALGALIADPAIPEPARRSVAGALNYLFKSLDLIPDGIDDIGYVDDAFVLRVAADLASQEELDGVESTKLQTLGRLANDCELVREFLGKDFGRLEGYVKALRRGAARGRSVQDIVEKNDVREAFLEDIRGFARAYQPPGFAPEEKNLVKLRAFFDAKLPK
jgi:uncharacterized membrane protein YkvA (DUF1232 family)